MTYLEGPGYAEPAEDTRDPRGNAYQDAHKAAGVAASELAEALQLLEQRLGPVLGPERPEAVLANPMASEALAPSPIVQDQQRLAAQLRSQRAHVMAMMRRLEV